MQRFTNDDQVARLSPLELLEGWMSESGHGLACVETGGRPVGEEWGGAGFLLHTPTPQALSSGCGTTAPIVLLTRDDILLFV
ncbi:hypothetical protein AAFF_G00122580 [Aldrovandia affinis]|uniref:Uncharacterized protein n=1 Tax=Aldrovandia affinis TaxID=143900 RepID=A0AAD7RSD1_9TELE|nr:hypothetical protein AAFF_G00122580 [Aldrovandia affinis]